MDVTPFLDIRPAPHAVFERARRSAAAPRFFVDHAPGAARPAWRPVSWGAFAAAIRAVALMLRARGIRAGERVAILAPNRVEWAAVALGIQTAGAAVVPVYPSSTAEQLAHVIAHSGARGLFVATTELIDRTAAVRGALPVEWIAALDEDVGPPGVSVLPWSEVTRERAGDLDALLAAIELDGPAMMLYTSGTSGPPKGVPLSHRNVGSNARDWLLCNAPALREGATELLWLPLSHIFGFGEMCLGNTLGFTSYLTAPADVLRRLPQVAPEVLMSVPAYWEKIAAAMQAAGEDAGARAHALQTVTGGRLSFCLSGGAGLAIEVKQLLAAHGLVVLEGYGLTECSPTLTLNRPDAHRFDSVGKPLPSVSLRLAADGEILARGPGVFGGYHEDPAATRAAFTADGWFRTGDLGRFTGDGFLQIVGRKKDILVTAGGKNIAPASIEERLCAAPEIEHVVVYGDGKRYLVAGIWPAAGAGGVAGQGIDGAVIAARVTEVNAGLARHETIKRWTVIDEPLSVASGTLTASLKLRRKVIYERFAPVFEALYVEAP